MAKGWWNENPEHGLASKGVKVKAIKKGNANQTAIKHRMNNAIQDDMLKLDRLMRKATKTTDVEKARQHIKEAEKVYERLGDKLDNYKQKHGGLAWWVRQTWHSKETFNKNGKVKKMMAELKECKPAELKRSQEKLFNAIKLPTESYGKQLSQAEAKKRSQDAYDKAMKEGVKV